jgi:hypothetical protein
MDMETLDEWYAEFVAFHSRFADVFRRKEPRLEGRFISEKPSLWVRCNRAKLSL